MFDDDDEQSSAAERAQALVPETRDLAAEITPATAEDDDDDRLESGLLERRDEAAEADVDGETATAFWAAVVYVNVGLLLVALGPMLALFRGRVQVGALLVVLGGFALYRASTVYRSYTAPDEGEAEANDEPEVTGDESAD